MREDFRLADSAFAASSRARRRWVALAAGLAGLALLAYLVRTIGPVVVLQQLTALGHVLPLVLLLTGMKYALQTAGWRLLLPAATRPPWIDSVAATIAGDALGYLTWAGPITGEPARAVLLRETVPVGTGVAAGAIERGVYNVTAFLLVLIVLIAVGAVAGRELLLVASAAAAASVLVWLICRRRAAIDSPPVVPALPSTAVRDDDAFRRGPLARLRSQLAALRDDRRRVLPALVGFGFAQHGLLVAEAYLMLRALGAAPTPAVAFVFEAVTKLVNMAGTFVPARLGVSEGGSALLAGALGFAASQGLSLALMRRARALIWSAVGLAVMPMVDARSRRSERSHLMADGADRRISVVKGK